MKAVTYEKYGPPHVLNLVDIPKPKPKENELLIKIHATSVTAGDCRMRRADPFLVRLFNGLFKPTRVKILGFELAGIVEEVGAKVKSFRKGDQVFASCGFRFGAYAEFTCLPEDKNIGIKPVNMSFQQAATVPIGGLTALQFLKQCDIKNNDKVMIFGASGSVGTFAVQIAKSYGADVTAVCSTTNINLVKELGADNVIDYTKDDFSETSTRFDIVFDAVGKASRRACKNILKRGGKFVSVTGSPKSNKDDLGTLRTLIEAGKVISVIDRTYKIEQVREAHTYVDSFRKKGNVSLIIVE